MERFLAAPARFDKGADAGASLDFFVVEYDYGTGAYQVTRMQEALARNMRCALEDRPITWQMLTASSDYHVAVSSIETFRQLRKGD